MGGSRAAGRARTVEWRLARKRCHWISPSTGISNVSRCHAFGVYRGRRLPAIGPRFPMLRILAKQTSPTSTGFALTLNEEKRSKSGQYPELHREGLRRCASEVPAFNASLDGEEVDPQEIRPYWSGR